MADLSGIDLLDVAGRYTTLSKKAMTNGGEYEGPCPFCGGTDRFLVWPTPPNKDRGAFWCRQCDKKGDALTLIMEREQLSYPDACRQLGIMLDEQPSSQRKPAPKAPKPVQELPRPPDNPERKTPTTIKAISFETLASSHGLALADLKKWNFGKTSRRNRSAVVFPTPTGSRWRFLDGNKPKYDSIPNYQRCWYGLDRRTVPEGWSTALEIAQRQQTPLILCNGELSTIKGIKSGLAAFSLAGGESGEFTPEQLAELKAAWQGGIFVVLDGDTGGWASGMKRAMQLVREGFMVEVLDLGGVDGYDLADFCMDASGPAYIALLKCDRVEIPAPLPAPQEFVVNPKAWQAKGFTLADLQYQVFAPPTWVIENILPAGACLLGAKPKMKKSWLALGAGLAVAFGGKAFGYLPVQQGRVLYIDLDSAQPMRVQRRVASILGRYNTKWPDTYHVFTEWPNGEEGLRQLEEWLIDYPDTKLVVIDVLNDFRRPMDAKTESYYAYDRATIKPINDLFNQYQVAGILVHHLTKGTPLDIFDANSGSTGLQSAVDTMWVMERDRNDSKITVLHPRGRDLEMDEPIALRWDEFSMQHILEGPASEVTISIERKAVLVLFEDDEPHSPKDIAEALQKPVGAVKRLLGKLLADGLIEKSGYGKYVLVRGRGIGGNSGIGGIGGIGGNSSLLRDQEA